MAKKLLYQSAVQLKMLNKPSKQLKYAAILLQNVVFVLLVYRKSQFAYIKILFLEIELFSIYYNCLLYRKEMRNLTGGILYIVVYCYGLT